MALFGPRLDRPSALGDEGRPRATSLTIASLLVFALLVVATTCPWRYSAGFQPLSVGAAQFSVPMLGFQGCGGPVAPPSALAFGTVAGLVTAGVALLNRERFTALFVGQLIFLPAGTALVSGLAMLLVVQPAMGVMMTGFAVTLVALGSTWTDTASAETVRPAIFQGGLSYLSIIFWGIFGGILFVAVRAIRVATTSSPETTQPTGRLFLFLLFVAVGAILFRLGFRWLPIRQLAPQRKQAAIEHTLRKSQKANTVIVVVALVGLVGSIGLSSVGLLELLYRAVPPVEALFNHLMSGPIVAAVLGVGVLSLTLGVLSLAVRRLTRPAEAKSNRLLAPFVAGLFLTIGMLTFAFQLIPIPGTILQAVGRGGLLLTVLFGPIGLYSIGGAYVVAEYLSILPSRAGGPALASAGLIVATIGAALLGYPASVVVATAAVAMAVWDVSSFGLGLTAELGHVPETRRLELFHALVVLVIAVVTVLGLSLLELVRTAVAGTRPTLVAAGLAILGVLVLLVPLRGYVDGEAVD